MRLITNYRIHKVKNILTSVHFMGEIGIEGIQKVIIKENRA